MLNLLVLCSLFFSIGADCPPNSVFESIFNKCYLPVDEPLGFLAAEENCQSFGGHLLAIQNAFENSFVASMSVTYNPVYWIGANYLSYSNWSWTYNTPFIFSNFNGQSPDPSMYQCAGLRGSDGNWVKTLCNTPMPSICTIDPSYQAPTTPTSCPIQPTTTPPPPSTPQPTCSASKNCTTCCTNGYISYYGDGRCYKFKNVDVSFEDGEAACANDGAVLVKITNDNLNTFLTDYYTSTPAYHLTQNNPWIGLFCKSSSLSSCTWSDGSPLLGYNNFASGYPSNYDAIFLNHNGKWYSSHQTSTIICQKNAE